MSFATGAPVASNVRIVPDPDVPFVRETTYKINGVGGTLIPLLRNTHLGWKNFDKFTESHEGRPARAGVTAEAERFILRENENSAESGVNAIGKGDVDDAIESAKGDGGLGTVSSKRPEAFTLTASKKDRDGLTHIGHEGDSRSRFWKQPSVTGVGRSRHVQRIREGLGTSW